MQRILIVKLSSLGDLFHALPTVHALRTGFGAEIDWVTQPEYAALVRCFTDVNRVIEFPRRALPGHLPGFLRDLRRMNYDIVIDLQGLMKSALIAAAARARRRIGPSGAREGSYLLYHARAGRKNKARHAVDELFDVVRHLGLSVPEKAEFPVRFPFMPVPGKGPHIALCPCSRAAGKNWPADRFVQAAKVLSEKTDATIHLVGGPADRTPCETMAAAIGPSAVSHAGKTSLVELGGLLQQMHLLITVDSGPMHMAASVGTPVLALFGPTASLRTGPYGRIHCIIESPFQPAGKKISRRTRRRDFRYMEAIPVEPVAAKALEMLGDQKNSSCAF